MRTRAVVFGAVTALLLLAACNSATGPDPQLRTETAARESSRLPHEFVARESGTGEEWAPPGDGSGGAGAPPLVRIVTPRPKQRIYCDQQNFLAWSVEDMPGLFRVTAEVWFENGKVYYAKLCEREYGATSMWWRVPDVTCREALVRVTVEFLVFRPGPRVAQPRDVFAFGGEWSPPRDDGGGGGWEVVLTQTAQQKFGPVVARNVHRMPHERN